LKRGGKNLTPVKAILCESDLHDVIHDPRFHLFKEDNATCGVPVQGTDCFYSSLLMRSGDEQRI